MSSQPASPASGRDTLYCRHQELRRNAHDLLKQGKAEQAVAILREIKALANQITLRSLAWHDNKTKDIP